MMVHSQQWDKNDPEWSFLNGKTSKEIQEMIENYEKRSKKDDESITCMRIILTMVLLHLYKR